MSSSRTRGRHTSTGRSSSRRPRRRRQRPPRSAPPAEALVPPERPRRPRDAGRPRSRTRATPVRRPRRRLCALLPRGRAAGLVYGLLRRSAPRDSRPPRPEPPHPGGRGDVAHHVDVRVLAVVPTWPGPTAVTVSCLISGHRLAARPVSSRRTSTAAPSTSPPSTASRSTATSSRAASRSRPCAAPAASARGCCPRR